MNVGANGAFLVEPDGVPLEAEYVYTQPGIELEGRRVATGTTAGLVLWEVNGPVRAPGVTTNEELAAAACAPA